MTPPAFDAISVGDSVPTLVRTIDAAAMIAYAGATWDWHRMHYDAEYLRAAGLPGPVVDGQVFGALLIEQAQDWLGPWTSVHAVSFRFKSLVFAGETVRCEGTVTSRTDERLTAALRVVVLAEDGSVSKVAAEPCQVEVVTRR